MQTAILASGEWHIGHIILVELTVHLFLL